MSVIFAAILDDELKDIKPGCHLEFHSSDDMWGGKPIGLLTIQQFSLPDSMQTLI